MNTNPQQHPTQFYGRTWIYWTGVLVLGPFVAFWSFVGALVLLDIEPYNGMDKLVGIIPVSIGLLYAPMILVCCFQVFARQTPTLKIYQEGMIVRSFGISIRFDSNNLIGQYLWHALGAIYLPLIVLWQCITSQAFRIRTVQLRWENFDVIRWTETGSYAISGWSDKDRHDSAQDTPLEHIEISCTADSFGTPIAIVSESVQFFRHNPDARESLPSWQDEDTLLGNETFDFR